MNDLEHIERGFSQHGKMLKHESMIIEYEQYEEKLAPMLQTEPKEHQKCGIAWCLYREATLKNGCRGGFIMDEAGCGKTFQTLCVVALSRKPTLVVLPTHLIHHWISEIDRHFVPGTFTYAMFYGSNRHTSNISLDVDIIFTSYGVVQKDFAVDILSARNIPKKVRPLFYPGFRRDSFLDTFNAERIIFDESHNFRNNTKTSNAITNLFATHVWCITATPIMNRINDLFNQISVLGISPFDQKEKWKQCIINPMVHNPITTFDILLRHVIVPFSIRRLKKDLNTLPPRNEDILWLSFNDQEESIYEMILQHTKQKILSILQNMSNVLKQSEKKQSRLFMKMRMCTMVFILRLRQCCCHPQFVLKRMLKDTKMQNLQQLQQMVNGEIEGGQCKMCLSKSSEVKNDDCPHTLCLSCAKEVIRMGFFACPVCECRVEKWKRFYEMDTVIDSDDEKEEEVPIDPLLSCKARWVMHDLGLHSDKVVIVSQWIEHLNMYAKLMENLNYRYIYLDGSVAANRRSVHVDKFQTDKTIRVCLLSLTASSEGINLNAACRVYHVDAWWNDSRSSQASDRVHRIGQEEDVYITHLRVRNTIEVAMHTMVMEKKKIAEVVNGERAPDVTMSWANSIRLILSERELLAYKHLLKDHE